MTNAQINGWKMLRGHGGRHDRCFGTLYISEWSPICLSTMYLPVIDINPSVDIVRPGTGTFINLSPDTITIDRWWRGIDDVDCGLGIAWSPRDAVRVTEKYRGTDQGCGW